MTGNLQHYLAVYVTDSDRWSADSDDKSIAGGVDDLGGDPIDAVVEFHHPFGAGEGRGLGLPLI
ncbi:hypothetical protein GCM10010404_90420 [Nonomuraea africana]